MWVQQIQVRSNRLSSPQARSRIQERVSLLWWCPSLTEPTYLSDLQITVVCLKIPLFCLQIQCSPLLAYRHVFLHNRSRTGVLQALYHHRLSPFHAIRTSCVVLVAHKLTAKFTDPTYHQLVMLTSMSICPPCICNHRRKALVVAYLSTLPHWLPLHRLLVFCEADDTLGSRLSNIGQNSVFPY